MDIAFGGRCELTIVKYDPPGRLLHRHVFYKRLTLRVERHVESYFF
jgi:hypothetical protein